MKDTVKKVVSFVAGFLKEKSGKPSNMRLNVTQIVTTYSLSTGFAIIWTAVKHPEFVTGAISAATVGMLGAFAGKKLQKKDESADSEK